MEDGFPDPFWTARVACHAFWACKCTEYSFQRYINYTLQEFLDDFASAYVDDVLVFTDGTREQHREHVRKVLQKLQDAGLQLDIDMCEFEVHSTKYLGFIIEAGKGLRMDPAKVRAITDWKAPTSVKGVLGFLGFANFYRRFLKDFSQIAVSLYALVIKDTVVKWTAEADQKQIRYLIGTSKLSLKRQY